MEATMMQLGGNIEIKLRGTSPDAGYAVNQFCFANLGYARFFAAKNMLWHGLYSELFNNLNDAVESKLKDQQ
jgi:hypothetical protein